MKYLIPFVAAAALCMQSLTADTVYVTAATQPSGLAANGDGQYTEIHANALSGTTAFSTAVGAPTRTASRFRALSGFTNGEPIVRISPFLGTPGGVYRVHYTHSSTANNSSTAAIVGFTNLSGCTLSFSESDAFQRKYGQPAPQPWTFLGYLTNDPGVSTPSFEIFLKSTGADALTLRFLVDCFRFTLDDPCLNIPTVDVAGPLSTNLSQVTVRNVATNANKITVYQDNGSGMVEIGSKTEGIVGGVELVTVTGLIKGAQVSATQTIGVQQGCVPTAGTLVGGGANPSFRLALSVRDTSTLGPIGANGTGLGSIIHFLGATTVSGGAPTDSMIISPSNDWQTVTFDRGTILMSNASNAVGTAVDGAGYQPNDSVSIRVFAFKLNPETGLYFYSRVGAQSANISSNGFFDINWTWDAAPEAEGYRLIRHSTNNGNYTNSFVDIFDTSFLDSNNSWTIGTTGNPATALPNTLQTNPSIQWNPSANVGANTLTNKWYILESLAITIDDIEDVGPFDFYIDNLQNGETVFQTFEGAVAGQTDFGFRVPGFSGTTSGNLLPAPNIGVVSNDAADEGTKSFRVQFQWNGTTATKWLRLTTSGVGNPVVDLDQPVSMRLLLLPVGNSPTPPPAPSLSVSVINGNTVLNWEGAHRLLESANVEGPYTINGATLAPYTNTTTDVQKFYRLRD